MGRAIKLILYYLAYQLLFIFLATGTDATIALIGGADITANFRPGTIAISIGMLLSALAMTWHLVHFHYVKFNKESMYEVSKRIILLCLPLLLSASIRIRLSCLFSILLRICAILNSISGRRNCSVPQMLRFSAFFVIEKRFLIPSLILQNLA